MVAKKATFNKVYNNKSNQNQIIFYLRMTNANF